MYQNRYFFCPHCNKTYQRLDTLDRHTPFCRDRLLQQAGGARRVNEGASTSAGGNDNNDDDARREPAQIALSGRAAVYAITPSRPVDVHMSIADFSYEVQSIIRSRALALRGVRWYITMALSMVRAVHMAEDESEGHVQDIYIQSGRYINLMAELDNIVTNVESASLDLLDAFDKVVLCGSGWVLRRVNIIELHIVIYQPLGRYLPATRGRGYLPTPDFLSARKLGILNIHSNDDFCFVYCVLAAIFQPPWRVQEAATYRRLMDRVNISGLNFPISVK